MGALLAQRAHSVLLNLRLAAVGLRPSCFPDQRGAGAWPGVHAPAAGLTGQAGDLAAGWVLAGICGLIAVMVGWAAARSPAGRGG
jgi:hypothetical protein